MPRLTDENHIKLYLLFLMDKISYPISYSDIQEVVAYGEFVGYFDFEHIFGLLEKEGCVTCDRSVSPEVYTLHQRGEQIVRNLSDLLDYEIRDKGLRAAMRHLQYKKTGADVAFDYKAEGDGYRFNLRISEKSINKMDLSMYIDEKQMAENMLIVAEKRPEVIYRGVLALLTGDARFLPLD